MSHDCTVLTLFWLSLHYTSVFSVSVMNRVCLNSHKITFTAIHSCSVMCFTSQKTVKYFFLFSFNCTREKRDTHEEITWHTQNFPSPTKSCSHKVHKTSTKTESEVERVREFKYICIEILCFIALTLKKEHKWFCVCFASIIYDTSNIDDDYYYDSASLSLSLV